MRSLIQDGKYQVLEVLEEQDNYKACLCIDVETNNDYKPLIFLIYEDDADIRRFLPAFFNLNREQFPDFIRVMSGTHNIMAVFAYHQGVKLREYFRRDNRVDFEERVNYAGRLLKECLILDVAADFIAASCLEPEHLVVADKSQKVRINYLIRPRKDDGLPFKGQKLAVLLECVFVKNRYVPDGLWEYIDSLRKNENETVGTAFSRWKEISEALLQEHRSLLKETWPAYLVRRLKQRLKKKKDRFFPETV